MQKTLVLGASPDQSRYSNLCIRELVARDFPVEAVGLRGGTVAGIPIREGLPDLSGIDTVTLYVGPRNQPAYYEYILSLKPSRVIFNPGTENPDFEAMLSQAGIEVVAGCSIMMLHADIF